MSIEIKFQSIKDTQSIDALNPITQLNWWLNLIGEMFPLLLSQSIFKIIRSIRTSLQHKDLQSSL